MNVAAVVITCPGREELCRNTVEALRATDWPDAWPIRISSDQAVEGTRQDRQQLNARTALHIGIEMGTQFVLFLEDDLAFNANLCHNLTQWRPLRDGWLGMASLYNPTIHELERSDHEHWFRADPNAVYGSQAYLFAADTARFIAQHWHEVEGMQDIKMSRLAARGGWPIYYHSPSLVQHIGKESTWGGGYHHAPGFSAEFKADRISEHAPFDRHRHTGMAMKSYADIPGWFNEEWLYDRMISRAPDNAIFVEVGCWLGKGTAYCARRIHESGKRIQLYVVDTWEGFPNEPALMETVARAGGSVFEIFRSNMEAAGIIDSITPVKMPTVVAANQFEDDTLHFVFIDADHSCDAVKADIAAWRPKVKSGGTLAGHDWNTYGSVQEAVKAMLGGKFTVEGNCWIHERTPQDSTGL